MDLNQMWPSKRKQVTTRLLQHSSKSRKSQSAMEYLVTYGWAIVILVVALAALYGLGVFNPATYTPNVCSAPGDFSCTNTTLYSTGNFAFTLEQSTSSPIYITAVGCNTNVSTVSMKTFNSLFLPIGSNTTKYVQCYSGNVPFSNGVGTVFTGYLIVNYTNINTGFTQTIITPITQKVASSGSIPTSSVSTTSSTSISTTTSTTSSTSTSSTSTSTSTSTTSTSTSTSSTSTSTSTSTTSTSTSTSTTSTIYETYACNSWGNTGNGYVPYCPAWTQSGSTFTCSFSSIDNGYFPYCTGGWTQSGSTYTCGSWGSSGNGYFYYCQTWTQSGSTWTCGSWSSSNAYYYYCNGGWTKSGSTYTCGSWSYTQFYFLRTWIGYFPYCTGGWIQSGSTYTCSSWSTMGNGYLPYCSGGWTQSGSGGTWVPFIGDEIS